MTLSVCIDLSPLKQSTSVLSDIKAQLKSENEVKVFLNGKEFTVRKNTLKLNSYIVSRSYSEKADNFFTSLKNAYANRVYFRMHKSPCSQLESLLNKPGAVCFYPPLRASTRPPQKASSFLRKVSVRLSFGRYLERINKSTVTSFTDPVLIHKSSSVRAATVNADRYATYKNWLTTHKDPAATAICPKRVVAALTNDGYAMVGGKATLEKIIDPAVCQTKFFSGENITLDRAQSKLFFADDYGTGISEIQLDSRVVDMGASQHTYGGNVICSLFDIEGKATKPFSSLKELAQILSTTPELNYRKNSSTEMICKLLNMGMSKTVDKDTIFQEVPGLVEFVGFDEISQQFIAK